MGREVDLCWFHQARDGDCLRQGESLPVVSLVGETPIVRLFDIRHTADTPGLETVAFHRIRSPRRVAES